AVSGLVAAVLPLAVGLDAMRQLAFSGPAVNGLRPVGAEMLILGAMGVIFLVAARFALAYLEHLARREGRLTLRWQ
ncbi:MAG: hypothetical protein ACXWWL_05355, partial [Candidatus Limnocylindria bacterium]